MTSKIEPAKLLNPDTAPEVSISLHSSEDELPEGSGAALTVHVDMYVLARTYGIEKLKMLAFHKMQRGLARLLRDSTSPGRITADLILECDLSHGYKKAKEMMDLLTLFAAQHGRRFGKEPHFLEIMSELSNVSYDFISHLCNGK